MPDGEASVEGYIHWLSSEVAGLREVFTGVILPQVEGALTMAGSSIDLTAIQVSAAISGGRYLAHGEGCVKSSMHSVEEMVALLRLQLRLAAIQAKLHKVNICTLCI
jgi:hypothetical protein